MSIERRLRREQSRQQAKLIKGTFGDKGFEGKLTAFGAFYKDSDDDGFSMFVSMMDMAPEAWDALIVWTNDLEQGYKQAMAEIFQQWERLDLPSKTWEAFRQERNDEAVESLQDYIKEWNLLAFGSETRPPKGDIRNIGLGRDELQLFLQISGLVYGLEQEGVIKTDNFNGMIYHHMSGGFTVIS
jgi:hypothetical protein